MAVVVVVVMRGPSREDGGSGEGVFDLERARPIWLCRRCEGSGARVSRAQDSSLGS